jgi:beta-N-acetylhexosaminidase
LTHFSTKISVIPFLFSLIALLTCYTKVEPSYTDNFDPASILMVGFRGTDLNAQDALVRDIINHKVGGVILFDYDVPTKSYGRNITDPDQLKKLTSELKEKLSKDLLIAVDQEGGKVNRLKSDLGFMMLPSQSEIASKSNVQIADSLYRNQASELSEMGFNVNFAPVVDLNLNPDNPIIGKLGRSFSSSPDTVAKFAEIAIKAYQDNGILPVLKHFPGHGSSREDSHLGVVDVTRYWNNIELKPYSELINDSAHFGIMTAHIYNRNLDAEWPATLSYEVINKKLKTELGFRGLVFSDDLQMEAIRNEYDLKTTIKRALLAGVDILVFANNSIFDADIVDKSIKIIRELAEENDIIREQVISAQNKIAKLHQHKSHTDG